MRIAYIALGAEQKNMTGGVGRKIRTHVRLWIDMGHSVRLFALVPKYRSPDIYTYMGYTAIPGIRDFTRMVSRSRALVHLISDVRAYRPELIYLRCGAYVFPLHRLFSIAPIVLELNTNDMGEARLRGWYFYLTKLLTRGVLLRNVSGLVAVTHEIAGLTANRTYDKPTRVIGNGIDLRQYRPLPAPKNSRPAITMIGSPGMTWHGVDKLICLARMCPDLDIHVVGYQAHDFSGDMPTNVQIHGFLDCAGVMDVLAKSDVACGSLALERVHMKEGSTLKVREAAAYGIPLLLGYHDTDLSDLENECIMQLPNTVDNVITNAEKIRSFSYRMMGKRIARDAIASRIDQRPKEENRLSFFEEILKNEHRDPA